MILQCLTINCSAFSYSSPGVGILSLRQHPESRKGLESRRVFLLCKSPPLPFSLPLDSQKYLIFSLKTEHEVTLMYKIWPSPDKELKLEMWRTAQWHISVSSPKGPSSLQFPNIFLMASLKHEYTPRITWHSKKASHTKIKTKRQQQLGETDSTQRTQNFKGTINNLRI